MTKEDQLKALIGHAKEYGFVFPSSEIYDGLSATYDYGPLGVELKNNIKNYWWEAMVRAHENIVGIDTAIFMEPTTWKASGHLDAFNDPLIDNKDSKKRYRADALIEEHIEKLRLKIDKEVAKGKKRFGDDFDEATFRATHPQIVKRTAAIKDIEEKMQRVLEEEQWSQLKQLIEELNITCPVSGSSNWTDVRQFNLMFSTTLGSVSGESSTVYLRPETAQGIFVNFLNVQKSSRMKIPFGIAQIGKAFRNEIIARQFIFRMREFEQMEMQFFVRPGDEMQWYAYWKETRMNWHKVLGFDSSHYRFHDHLKLAHYANAATDIEFNFPMGFKELEGIHSRTDFDLQQHEQFSGKKLRYFDTEINRSYVPYVIETSIGLDRMFLATLSQAYKKESLEEGTERTVLMLPPALAPYKVAVMPLTKKEGLPNRAREIMHRLKMDVHCQYDEKDSIGKRYRRQDAIGTPYSVTVDHQTLEDNTVTIRDRDTMQQKRIPTSDIYGTIREKISLHQLVAKATLPVSPIVPK